MYPPLNSKLAKKLIIGSLMASASFFTFAACYETNQSDSQGRCVKVIICISDPQPRHLIIKTHESVNLFQY